MVAERISQQRPDWKVIRGGRSTPEPLYIPGVEERLELIPHGMDVEALERRGSSLDSFVSFGDEQPKSGEIFSSTGNLGQEVRPFNRLYDNRKEYSDDTQVLIADFTRMTGSLSEGGEVTRAIMRGLVSPDVLRELLRSPFGINIEVAMNVVEFTGEDSWLVYLAKNSSRRTPIVEVGDMIWITDKDKSAPTEAPDRRIQKVLDKGYRFVDIFTLTQAEQVYDLWRDTFGWSLEEVLNLRRRLHDRDEGLWFSAVIDSKGDIITASTAERLDVPSSDGTLSLVENTEWRTKEGHQGKGLMTATLDMLNAQILYDLMPNGNGQIPLIYAECNYQSRSDRAGHGAGFSIPERVVDGYMIPQVIVQNVGVGDNQPVPPDKLRDFTFMYLPANIIRDQYKPEQVAEMIGKLTHV